MAILTYNHYINEANSFITDIRNNRNGYYIFVARSQSWVNNSGQNDDTAVLPSNNSVAQVEQTAYDDLLFGKLLKDGDVNHLVPRYNWIANTVYNNYSQNDTNLFDKQFFVVTDKYEVYKCLDNNNGANSFVKPTLTVPSGTFQTGDGYTWKYMYTIDPASNTKYTTADYVPVTTNTQVQGNTTPGSIDVIRVTNGGGGYFIYETGYINSAVNKYIIQLPASASSVDDYYTNSSIYLKSGAGAGQIREISSSNGTSKQILVNEPFDIFTRLDIQNVVGSVAIGYFVEQPFDNINYLFAQGYFNIDSTITQTDTGIVGKVLASNTSDLQITRFGGIQFSLGLPFVDVSQSGVLKTGTVSVANVGACNLAFVTSGGSGYNANGTVTITANVSGSGAVANAQSDASGKITAINIQTAGNSYFIAPSLTISAPVAQTFNSNTDVTAGTGGGSNNTIALVTAPFFVANDLVTYTVSAGNTAVGGLANGTTYFIDFANATVVALKPTAVGTRITLTKGPTQTGHILQGKTAEAVMFCDNQIVVGSGTQLNSAANGYSNGEYIRVGANTTSNIRRVANAVNTTVLIATSPFKTSFTASANAHFKMLVAAEPVSIVVTGANGDVSDINLTSVKLAIANLSLAGIHFTNGEKVNLTNSTRENQGANAIIAFSNTSTVILSSVSGTWLANSGGTQFFVSGESSLQLSQIVSVQSNPNLTLSNPDGVFKLGYPVTFKLNSNSSPTGNATVVALVTFPNDQTEYEIGPSVKVTGDGSNCVAIAVVNTAANSTFSVVGIDIVNPGSGYTEANVSIYANTNYGSNATAIAVISPVYGHGFDAVTELGGRYVGVNFVLDEIANESYDFPGYGTFRKAGIIENPQFRDIKVTLTDFDRVNMTLTGYAGNTTWTPGEVVVQPVTKAAGVVASGNSTSLQLKNVKGTFSVSNTVNGFFSNSSANVTQANTIFFPVGNAAQIITQSNSGSTGIITQVVSNTVYFMSNVVGQFATGDVMFDSVVNAFATVSTIFTANGVKDVSSNFGDRFNQTVRITLTANTGAFVANEYVKQNTSLATGRIVSSTNETDLIITNLTGSITVGQTITDIVTNANGICTFSNSTYLKVTSISQNLPFGDTDGINNGLGATANISLVLPVIVLNDVSDQPGFQAGSNAIIGQTSGASGTCNNHLLIKQPDLVRDSGKVIYSESFSPATRSATSKEEIKLVIKF